MSKKINTALKTKTDTVTVLNDRKTAQRITALYNELVKQSYQAFLKAVELGEELVKVKDSLAHGQFTIWLKKNTPFISERTARRYMSVYTKKDFLKDRLGENLGLKDAYNLLQEQKKGKGKGKNDNTLTDSESNAIIEQHEIEREKKKKEREEINRIRKRIKSGKQVEKTDKEKAKSYLETRMNKLISDMEKLKNELSLIG